MKIAKSRFGSFLMVIMLLCLNSYAQTANSSEECDLKVESKATNPDLGKTNGKIELTFSDTSKKYKVFLINKGEDVAKKDQGDVINNLGKGFYDIMITDNKGCFKQITITLN